MQIREMKRLTKRHTSGLKPPRKTVYLFTSKMSTVNGLVGKNR